MAEYSTIARPYATALFDAVLASSGNLQSTAEVLYSMAQVIEMDDMRQALSDPRFNDEQREDLIKDALEGVNLDQHVLNLLSILIANDRLLSIPEIASQFQRFKDKFQGIAQAEIVSAFPMSDEQVTELVGLLEPKFNLKLQPHVSVDDSLIGGVRVVVGDYVLDTSVRAQLNRMRDALVA